MSATLTRKKKKRVRRINRDENGYPVSVQIVSGENMCRDDLHGPGDTHCLLGQLECNFGATSLLAGEEFGLEAAPEDGKKAYKEAQNAIKKAIFHYKKDLCGCEEPPTTWDGKPLTEEQQIAAISIPTFNDNRQNPKSLLATIWNRAMAYLGYTKGNPDAEDLPHHHRLFIPEEQR